MSNTEYPYTVFDEQGWKIDGCKTLPFAKRLARNFFFFHDGSKRFCVRDVKGNEVWSTEQIKQRY